MTKNAQHMHKIGIILQLLIQIHIQKKQLFEFAIQGLLQNGIYKFEQDQFTISFWFKLEDRILQTEHTILKLQNDNGESQKLFLSTTEVLQFTDINQQVSSIYGIPQYFFQTHDPSKIIQRKTDHSYYWFRGLISYSNNTVYTVFRQPVVEFTITSFDYSTAKNGFVDFSKVQSNCKVIWDRVILWDEIADSTNYDQFLHEKELIGYYYFYFMHKNRQFVENLVQPKNKIIQIKEKFATPNRQIVNFKTDNVFSGVKIIYPNFWRSIAWFDLKFVMKFVLIFQKNIKNQTTATVHNLALYKRQFADTSQGGPSTITSQYQISFTYDKLNDFAISTQLSNYFDLTKSLEDQVISLNYQHGINEQFQFIFYGQLQAKYNQNNYCRLYFKINDSVVQENAQNIIFSSKDIHFTSFNYDETSNPFYVIIVQEVFFYQEPDNFEDFSYLDSQQKIMLQTSNSQNFPFVQERFVINNNNYLTFENQTVLQLNQKCDSQRYCQRCIDFKCILCDNTYYLENGICVKCYFPQIVVDGLCMIPTKKLDSGATSDPNTFINEIFNYMQNQLFLQTYIEMLIFNSSNMLIMRLQYTLLNEIVNNNLTFMGQPLNQGIQEFFDQQTLAQQIQIQFLLYETNIQPQNANQIRTFKCPNLFLFDDEDKIGCYDICPDGTYNLTQNICEENSMGCASQDSTSLNQCSTCNTGFTQIIYGQSSHCIAVDINYSVQDILYGHNDWFQIDYSTSFYNFLGRFYQLCNTPANEFLNTQSFNCETLQITQGDQCTQLLSSDGSCNFSSSLLKIANGYKLQSDNVLFKYFMQNSLSYFDNTCQTSINFDGVDIFIQQINNLCIWDTDLNTNGILKNCLFYDENCQDCGQPTDLCTSCSVGNLLELDYFNICGNTIPNCQKYINYRNQILCQDCNAGYFTTTLYNQDSIYGICLDTIITNCVEYEYDSTTVECKFCDTNSTLVYDSNKICVLNHQLVTNCIEYYELSIGEFQCINCDLNYQCLDQNGSIVTPDTSIPIVCYSCLSDTYVIQNCHIYNSSQQCDRCYLTYSLSSSTICDDNCDTYDINNTSVCELCKSGSVLYNDACYKEIIGCESYTIINCLQCDANHRKLYDDQQKMDICYEIIQYCEIYNDVDYYKCDTCVTNTRYYQYTGSYDVCGLLINNCVQYSTTDHLKCLQCAVNYRQFETINDYDNCAEQIDFCETYSTTNMYVCDSCTVNYRAYSTTGYNLCVQEILNCQIYSTVDEKVCDQCYTGYRRFQTTNDFDQCVQEILNCVTYSVTNEMNCDTCDNNYRIFATTNFDKCVQVINDCQNYSTIDFRICDNCIASYRKFITSGDFDQCFPSIDFCQQYSTSDPLKCDTCQTDYRVFITNTYDRCDPIIQQCQTYSATNYYFCDACNTGYRIYNTETYDQCQQEINQCYTYSNIDYYTCDACQIGYRVYNTASYDQCMQGIDQCISYSILDPLQCDTCNTGYRTYRQLGLLDICAEEIINCSSYSTSNQYTCDSCDTTFRIFNTNAYDICEQEILQCQTYSTTDQLKCDLCNNSYRVFETLNDFDQCIQVIDFCLTYSTTDFYVCDQCQTNYRQYDTLNFQECRQQITNCNTYSTNNFYACDQCDIGYRTFLVSGDYDMCKQEIQNCDVYDQTDFYLCQQCASTYRIFDTDNYDVCELEITQCLSHSLIDQLKCDACQNGYRIFETDNELDQCIIQIQNCSLYSASDYYLCENCDQNFRVFSTIDFDACVQEISLCQNYSQINELNCDNCQIGYRVFSILNDFDQCIQEIQNCDQYSTLDFMTCDTCLANYRVYNNTNDFDSCYKTIEFCDQYSDIDPFVCNTCQSSYRNFKTENYDICASIIDQCVQYSTSNQYDCDKCEIDYRVYNIIQDYDQCHQVITNCQTYSNIYYTKCDQCETSYRVFETDSFDQCQPAIQNCMSYSIQDYHVCQTCNDGYRIFINSGSFDECHQIIDYCLQYSSSDFYKCQQCQDGNRIFITEDYDICLSEITLCNVYSQTDQYKCAQCQNGYRVFQITNSFDLCVQTIPQCFKYSINNQKECDSCLNGYRIFKVESDFDKCPQIIQNCKTYSTLDQYTCSTCNDNYIKSKNDKNQYNECILLVENCKTIEDFKCIECNSGYQLLEDKGLCIQALDEEEKLNSVVQFAVPVQNCLLNIDNCLQCNAQECNECIQGYYLTKQTCKQQCLVNVNNCKQCNVQDFTKCEICQEGLLLINQECVDICQKDVPGYVCPSKLCFLSDINCLQCKEDQPDQCSKCKNGYKISQQYFCVKEENVVLRQIEQISFEPLCTYLCTRCEEGVCKQCMDKMKLENGRCIDTQQQEEIQKETQEKQELCLNDSYCFKSQTYFLRHCQKCKQFCNIKFEKDLNIVKLRSENNIYFSSNLSQNSDMIYIYYEDQTGMLDIQIQNLDVQNLVLQFSGENLIERSRDCIPQKIYQFSIKSSFQGIKQVKNAKSAGTAGSIGGFFNFSSLFLPRWIFGFFLGSLQTLDVMSYFSFNNLSGGSLYNLLNTFPEEKISIIKVQAQTNRDYYEKEYILTQYQLEFLNVFDQDSVYLAVGFLLTQILIKLKIFRSYKSYQK